MIRTIALVCCTLVSARLQAAAPIQDWKVYRNERFGFELCYPASLRPGPESGSGDGRAFEARDGAKLTVFGELGDIEGASLTTRAGEAEKDLRAQGATVTYRAKGVSWIVLSGTQGRSIYYHKIVFRDGAFRDLEISYPAAGASVWNSATARIARCFN
ncbi:hypothetical protein FHS31_000813 [Sphingomonas vulcanisoli]|uniref:Uncharacterized protein n=1 Tax=Sphingomonas vulcanisoli TaxID=1658060 RepID=A0ABX0TNZ0_9SPHN|nr:hypothetical protein [Sphingomonas vulcanisoli]NIJ07217.1 hypothetical protein [Sphingomonas vulcanisoli]